MGDDNFTRIRKARRLQELFHRRFTEDAAMTLMDHHDWDILATVSFIFESTEEEIREVTKENWQVVVRARRDKKLEAPSRKNDIKTEMREFACEDCDHVWWRKVPTRKKVSRCNCRVRYDALERTEEYGWAVYECPCGHEFRGYGAVGKTFCLCYRCKQHVIPPIRVLSRRPRSDNPSNNGDRRRPRHSCVSSNCYNRSLLPNGVDKPIVSVCVHPKSMHGKKVAWPSKRHNSSGSTVSTFLTQDGFDY